MTTLDVTEILDDPEFQTSFVVLRQIQTVGTDGRATVAGASSTQYGVVYPASGKTLVRTPEGENVIGDITVVSMFRLIDGGGRDQADIVTWKGTSYTVVNTKDYSQYGGGFIEATCIKKTLN